MTKEKRNKLPVLVFAIVIWCLIAFNIDWNTVSKNAQTIQNTQNTENTRNNAGAVRAYQHMSGAVPRLGFRGF